MATRQNSAEATLRDYKARMLRVLVHIQQHLDDALGLEELAAVACFSPYHFHRVFRGMIGESVKEHVRRLRLERAAGHLKFSRRPVTQIALDAGYETHESFTRAFKASFGVAPIRFRTLRRASQIALAERAPSGVHYRAETTLRSFKTMRARHENPGIIVKHIKPLRVAFVRHVGPYAGCSAAWDKVCTYMGKEGWLGGDTQFIGLSHDDPEVTPPDKIRYDACVTVAESFHPQGAIGVQIIPGGEYAVLTHFGPYEKLNETYARLMGQWLPRSGRELGNASCFEVYLNDPNSTEPEDLVTDVHVPLKPVRASTITSIQP